MWLQQRPLYLVETVLCWSTGNLSLCCYFNNTVHNSTLCWTCSNRLETYQIGFCYPGMPREQAEWDAYVPALYWGMQTQGSNSEGKRVTRQWGRREVSECKWACFQPDHSFLTSSQKIAWSPRSASGRTSELLHVQIVSLGGRRTDPLSPSC